MSGHGVAAAAHPFDRACIAIGLASMASVVFVVDGLNEFRFIWLGGASVAIALVVGALACLAGLLRRPFLAVVTGLAFLAATVLQVVSTALGEDWLGSDMSAASFWLGLGAGLLVLGLTPRDTAEPHTRNSAPPAPTRKGTG